MMELQDENVQLHLQVEHIRASGILSRSGHLNRIFDFLHVCYQEKRRPKELEVALNGLGRRDFDVTQDALVRVYMHKLRRKLDEYYQGAGADEPFRLQIPRGEYRLELMPGKESGKSPVVPLPEVDELPPELPLLEPLPEPLPQEIRAEPAEAGWHQSRQNWKPGFFLAVFLLFNGLAWWLAGRETPPETHIRASAPWRAMFADERPIIIVLGDYYMFAEADDKEKIFRLIRDFDINSSEDLAADLQFNPEQASRHFDVGLSYLPTSTAAALYHLAPVLLGGDKKPWGLVLASELIPENIHGNHIIYIGHLSGLGILEKLVFTHSGFRRGDSYDELVDQASGKTYYSSSGLHFDHDQANLAYLASFKGPAGNHILILAGFRDAGLQELANVLGDSGSLAAFSAYGPQDSFEILYQTVQKGAVSMPAKPLIIRAMKPGD
ncbi:MAG: hypothetical protein LBS89_02765 [Zoogloeaceae bacterium]|jgi:hypothetical protein|nr:hypothetical protein [Zoogloeaceae bacterium]